MAHKVYFFAHSIPKMGLLAVMEFDTPNGELSLKEVMKLKRLHYMA